MNLKMKVKNLYLGPVETLNGTLCDVIGLQLLPVTNHNATKESFFPIRKNVGVIITEPTDLKDEG